MIAKYLKIVDPEPATVAVVRDSDSVVAIIEYRRRVEGVSQVSVGNIHSREVLECLG
jgi:hypothetical protein